VSTGRPWRVCGHAAWCDFPGPVDTRLTLRPSPETGGTLTQPGCGLDESFAQIAADLAVSQVGATLSGTVEGAPAAGDVRADGWTFVTAPDCRPLAGTGVTCCLSFSVDSDGVASPSPADGTATGSCDDGST
jgi:hypothetical protein